MDAGKLNFNLKMCDTKNIALKYCLKENGGQNIVFLICNEGR